MKILQTIIWLKSGKQIPQAISFLKTVRRWLLHLWVFLSDSTTLSSGSILLLRSVPICCTKQSPSWAFRIILNRWGNQYSNHQLFCKEIYILNVEKSPSSCFQGQEPCPHHRGVSVQKMYWAINNFSHPSFNFSFRKCYSSGKVHCLFWRDGVWHSINV